QPVGIDRPSCTARQSTNFHNLSTRNPDIRAPRRRARAVDQRPVVDADVVGHDEIILVGPRVSSTGSMACQCDATPPPTYTPRTGDFCMPRSHQEHPITLSPPRMPLVPVRYGTMRLPASPGSRP